MTDVRNEQNEVIGHADPKGDDGVQGIQGTYDSAPEDSFLDSLEIDEEALARKQEGGGEAILDDEADCEGCKI